MTTQSLPESITDRYDIADLLGAGGQGAAYRAVERASGREVALKVLHRRLDDVGMQRQFEREVATLERLSGTPGVMPIENHGVADGRGWFVTERFPGTVADRLRSLGRLDSDEVRQLAVRVAAALAEVHKAGVLHRDLKPSNLFLRANGQPVLGDFGVSRIIDEQTLTASQGASLGFMAPETIELGETSERSDLYSLGATLYALVEGHPPFAAETEVEQTSIGVLIRRVTEGNAPPLRGDVPEDLADTIMALLSRDPQDRPDNAARVVDALQRGSGLQPIGEATRQSAGPRWSFAVAGLVVVALASFAIWNLRSDPEAQIATAAPAIVEPVATATSVVTEQQANQEPTEVMTAEVITAEVITEEVSTAEVITASGCDVSLEADSLLMCETFDSLDLWERMEDPSTATISVVDGEVFFVPVADAVSGSSYLERPVGPAPPDSDVVVRVRARLVDGPIPGGGVMATEPLGEWWQNVFGVADESQNTWAVGVQLLGGVYVSDLSFGNPPDNYGGELGDDSVALQDWTCIEMVLGRADGRVPELVIGDAPFVTVDDVHATNYGDGFVVRVGPIWVDPQPGMPTLVLDEVAVATEPMGC